MNHRSLLSRSLAAALVPAAAVAGAAPATAATTYPVSLCSTGTASAGLWVRSAGLPANVHTVECPAGAGLPASIPSAGNRGAAIFPPVSGITSSAGDPSAELRLMVPSSVTVTGGSVVYRGGTGSMAWRAYLRAGAATIAGCRGMATTGPDACAYDPATSYNHSEATATVPAGTTSLSVGLTCESVDFYGQTNPGCAGSSGVHQNGAYSAVVGGSLTVSDAAAPSGSATLAQETASGVVSTWTRRADARLRISDLTLADVGRGVCGLRLAPAGAAPTAAAWSTWTTPPNTATFRQCDLTAGAGVVDLSAKVAEGAQDLALTATDSDDAAGNRTVIATGTVRVDETAPTISFADVATSVGPDARVAVRPAIADALSGLASSSVTAMTTGGTPVAIDGDGRVTIPAGETVVVAATATDRVGLARTLSHWITAEPRPVDPGVDPPVDPGPGTTTPTTPTSPTDPGPGPGTNPPATTPAPTIPTEPTPPTPAPEPPAAKPVGRCDDARRSTVTRAWWSARTRQLTATGCRKGRQVLRYEVQVRVRKHGVTRTITKRYAIPGRAPVWTRSFRLRRGDVPLRVRVLFGSTGRCAWRSVTR